MSLYIWATAIQAKIGNISIIPESSLMFLFSRHPQRKYRSDVYCHRLVIPVLELHKWHCIICTVLCLAAFTQRGVSETDPCVSYLN